MINSNIEDGQVFQPNPENDKELIKYSSGRWLRSLDSGKTYSYRSEMQEKNKTDALAPDCIRIVDIFNERLHWAKDGEKEAEYKAYLEDQKRPLWERRTFNVQNPMAMIAMNEGILDSDIENALKNIVEKKNLEREHLFSTIRSLLRDHCKDDPIFNIAAYVDEIKNKVSDKADELGYRFPAFKSKFKHGAADNLNNRITELLEEFISVNRQESKETHSIPLNYSTSPESEISPNEIQPILYIPHSLQTRLYKTLYEYTPNDQHAVLESLLDKGFIVGRIWVKLSASSLAYLFYQARNHKDNSIIADMTETAKWVASYFDWGKKQQKPIAFDTVFNVLRKPKSVTKNNQIRLK